MTDFDLSLGWSVNNQIPLIQSYWQKVKRE